MSDFWRDRRVAVTGGAGFVGSHVVEQLVAAGARVTAVDDFSRGRREHLSAVRDRVTLATVDVRDAGAGAAAFAGHDVVLHLAARVAGVAYNQAHPAEMFRDNVAVTLGVLEAARQARVRRVEVVSTACVYPRDCAIPTPEPEGFRDDPDPSNLGYGWAKRMAEVQARLYAEEYGMAIGIIRPYNTYGPRDHCDALTSHVIPALIQRVLSGEDPVVVWGSGRQSRAFLYVEDFARGVLEAAERYPQPDPVNLGTTEEVTIQALITLILELCGRHPRVVFDTTKPEGQPRRNCDSTKAERCVGFRAQVPLREGLRRTIAWYRQHQHPGISCAAH